MKRTLSNLLGALALVTALLLLLNTAVAQSGSTLFTITNPAPAASDQFGYSVAAMGADRVLIGANLDDLGATDAGAAYLISTNGALLMTFTKPTPAASDFFGGALAVVGADRVLIGAQFDNTGALDAGAAYLFDTNGVLLTTFTNPAPAIDDEFGCSVAAVGTDRVLIGAIKDDTGASFAGAAYLFRTNGMLLGAFTNPAPAFDDRFGSAVAAVGIDRILIGAHADSIGASFAGAAFLFSTNGTLLTTFTNPTPATSDWFGWSLAALGNERVLIGARRDNTGADDAGAAYLFSINGTLLTTFTNPTPAVGDLFGTSVAAVGGNGVLIGAPLDDTGAADAGAVYLFDTDAPMLTIRLTSTNTVAVSWPSLSTDWTLQQNTNVTSVNWSNASGSIQDDGTTKTLIVDPPTGNRFYRLAKP